MTSQLQKRPKGQSRQLQASQSYFHPWKNHDGGMLQAKEGGVTRSRQHGFTKGILCLPKLIAFNDKTIEYVDG